MFKEEFHPQHRRENELIITFISGRYRACGFLADLIGLLGVFLFGKPRQSRSPCPELFSEPFPVPNPLPGALSGHRRQLQ